MSITGNRRWIVPAALLSAGVLMIVAGLAAYLIPVSGLPQQSEPPNRTDMIARVSLQAAVSAFEAGSAVFVDVRSASSFREGHIPGSLSIPISEVEQRHTELNSEDWIITICA